MLGIRENVEAIAKPLPKNIVAIAHGDPTPHDLLIPILSSLSATFRIIELEDAEETVQIARICSRDRDRAFS